MFFDTISNYILCKLIKSGKLTYDQYDEIDYKIKSYLSLFLIILFTVLLGIILNCLLQSIVVLIIIGVLRIFSGGVHAKSLESCTFLSTIYMSFLAYLTLYLYQQTMLVFFISIFTSVFIIKFIPAIDEDEKKYKNKYYRNNYINYFLLFYSIGAVCVFIDTYVSNLVCCSISLAMIGTALTVRENKN